MSEPQAKTLVELFAEYDQWKALFRDGAMGNQAAYDKARDTRDYFEKRKWVSLAEYKRLQDEKNLALDELAKERVRNKTNESQAKTDLTKQELMRIFEEQIELKNAEIQRLEGVLSESIKVCKLLQEDSKKSALIISDLQKRLSDIRKPEMLEKLAELEHEQWSELIQYLIGFAPIRGELTAKEFWREYHRLSLTPYSELTEKQKESDRRFARKVLGVLLQPDPFTEKTQPKNPFREKFSQMYCKKTGKDEWQSIIKESEDGLTLKCSGCGEEHSHEIGEFADRFQLLKCKELLKGLDQKTEGDKK